MLGHCYEYCRGRGRGGSYSGLYLGSVFCCDSGISFLSCKVVYFINFPVQTHNPILQSTNIHLYDSWFPEMTCSVFPKSKM